MTAPFSLGGRAFGSLGSTVVAAAAAAGVAASSGTTPVRARPSPKAARSPATSRTLEACALTPSQQGQSHSRCSS
eukprot:11201576-Lingulodinium_polyedra.AAC.1